jgi:hypothetical protein
MRTLILSACLALTSEILVAAADQSIDVSHIIDKAGAESVLGETVKNPSPRSGEGKDGYYSKCNYYTENRRKSLILRVQIPASGAIEPLKELELIAASTGPMKPVDGIGDKAQMFSGGGNTATGARVLMLYVVKGNAFLTVGLGGFDDETVALDKAKAIAQKLVEHL